MSDLIRRHDAIQAIDMIEMSKGETWYDLYRKALTALNNIPTAEPMVEEWIPCEERLPNETKARYLICTDDGYMCLCRWTDVNPFWTDLTTDWHWSPFDVPQYSKVVAWMPLKPYEAERSE